MKENLEIKAVATVNATPEEVLSAIRDPALRKQWDANAHSITKNGEFGLDVKYENHSEKLQIYSHGDKISPQGPHFIQEEVNGESWRFYELAAVKNRPYTLRITYYSRISPTLFAAKGKGTFGTLNSLKNFIN